MNKELLNKYIEQYLNDLKFAGEKNDIEERNGRKEYYQSFDKEKILSMTENVFYEYISKLWAMLIWGNKKYKIDQIIEDNGFEKLKIEIAELLFGVDTIDIRWDKFKNEVKGFGPAMMSELLCYVYPNDCMLWNRTAVTAYQILEIPNVPTHNYQMNGKKY